MHNYEITHNNMTIAPIPAIKMIRAFIPTMGLVDAKVCMEFIRDVQYHEGLTLQTTTEFIVAYLRGIYVVEDGKLYIQLTNDPVITRNGKIYKEVHSR